MTEIKDIKRILKNINCNRSLTRFLSFHLREIKRSERELSLNGEKLFSGNRLLVIKSATSENSIYLKLAERSGRRGFFVPSDDKLETSAAAIADFYSDIAKKLKPAMFYDRYETYYNSGDLISFHLYCMGNGYYCEDLSVIKEWSLPLSKYLFDIGYKIHASRAALSLHEEGQFFGENALLKCWLGSVHGHSDKPSLTAILHIARNPEMEAASALLRNSPPNGLFFHLGLSNLTESVLYPLHNMKVSVVPNDWLNGMANIKLSVSMKSE